MYDENQGDPPRESRDPEGDEPIAPSGGADDTALPPPSGIGPGPEGIESGWAQSIEDEPPPTVPSHRGFSIWLALLAILGVGGLFLNWQEMASLVAIAGLFVAAQAADVSGRWSRFNGLLSWVAPIFGAISFVALGAAFTQSSLSGTGLAVAVGFSMGGGAIAALSVIPWFANGLIALFFRTTESSHTLRLAARLGLLCFLLAVPGWFAFRYLLGDLLESPGLILDNSSLGAGLVGYIVLALASVGFLVRRSWPETVVRLGLKPLTLGHLGVTFLGLVALTGLNIGADWVQHNFFLELWESDQAINRALAQNMTVSMVLLLALSAGVGEEITLRGALQPKMGIILTSLLFASLHVQYSWFGMLVIFALGVLLGLIRRWTSTTVAILIHVLYDLLAVFSILAAE